VKRRIPAALAAVATSGIAVEDTFRWRWGAATSVARWIRVWSRCRRCRPGRTVVGSPGGTACRDSPAI